MIRNKLQVYLIKRSGGKTLINIKRPIRQVSGKKVNSLNMRAPMVDWGKLESLKAKSIHQAETLLKKFNIKNVSKAVYYNNEGLEHLIYINPQIK